MLEYRSWSGFYGSTSFELRYEPARSPWGFRAWSAHGYDEDHCASAGQCYHDTFWGADLTYRVAPRTRIYLGYQNLYRDIAWDGWTDAMTHSGLRIGVMGTFTITRRWPKLEGVYDIAYVPSDVLTAVFTSPERTVVGRRVTTGGVYRLGVRYNHSPAGYVEGGWWSWGFNAEGKNDFAGHIWLGPYVTLGVRF